MMTNKNSKFAKMKNYLAVPAFAVLAIVFAEKTYAKESIENQNQEKENVINKTPSETGQDNLMTNYSNERESVVMGSKGRSFTKGKDTIPIKKNVDGKLDEKPVQDISTAVEGVAADLVPAEYPGGNNELRKKMAYNFDSSSLDHQNSIIKGDVFIIVDENGKASVISAVGENEKFNNEAIRVAKLANENVTWTPGKKDGLAVRYRYKIPLAMQFAPNDKTQ